MKDIDVIELHIHSEVDGIRSNEIEQLELFLKGNQLKNILTKKLISPSSNQWTAQGEEYSSVLELILSPIVTVAGIKGIFDILKTYFEIKSKKIVNNSDTTELLNEKKKISFVYTKADGSKLELEFYSFDEFERQKFLKWIDTYFEIKSNDAH